jgi:hypothetical protein
MGALEKLNPAQAFCKQNDIVIQLEKRLAVFKIRLRFPFLSPPVGGSRNEERSPRAPRDSTFSKLNGYMTNQRVCKGPGR